MSFSISDLLHVGSQHDLDQLGIRLALFEEPSLQF